VFDGELSTKMGDLIYTRTSKKVLRILRNGKAYTLKRKGKVLRARARSPMSFKGVRSYVTTHIY
jgi:hypothetical protein